MNGKYQVGSGRIVAVTHDTPFIRNIVPKLQFRVKLLCGYERSNHNDRSHWTI